MPAGNILFLLIVTNYSSLFSSSLSEITMNEAFAIEAFEKFLKILEPSPSIKKKKKPLIFYSSFIFKSL